MARYHERVRLRDIETVDFRKSEATNLREILAKRRIVLRPGEAILLISSNQQQLIFVYAPQSEPDFAGKQSNKEVVVIPSRKFRIEHSTWNPKKLQDYANDVGLHLDGIKSYAEHYERLMKQRLSHRRRKV